MLRWIAVFVVLCGGVAAKGIDLSKIPADFMYTQDTELGPFTSYYVGREDGLFRFDTTTPNDIQRLDPYWFQLLNRKSQQVVAGDIGTSGKRYTWHDCAHTLGRCTYTVRWQDGTVDDVVTDNWNVGNILVSYIEIIYENGPEFWYIECVMVDRWGMDTDLYQINWDGSIAWQQRTYTSTGEGSQISREKLASICEREYDNYSPPLM